MIWLQFQNSVIDKHISMATSEDNYIWEHSWIGSCEDIYILKVLMATHILHFVIDISLRFVTSCYRGTNFHWFFLTKRFSEKYKHIELALHFIQKQYFG